MANTPEFVEYDGSYNRPLNDGEVQRFLDDVIWPALDSLYYPCLDFTETAMPGQEAAKHTSMFNSKGEPVFLGISGSCYFDHENTSEGEEAPILSGVTITIEMVCKEEMNALIDAVADSEPPQVVDKLLDNPGAYRPWKMYKFNFTTDAGCLVNVDEHCEIREAGDDEEVYWEPPVIRRSEEQVSGVYGYNSDNLRMSDRIAIEGALYNLGIPINIRIPNGPTMQDLETIDFRSY